MRLLNAIYVAVIKTEQNMSGKKLSSITQ